MVETVDSGTTSTGGLVRPLSFGAPVMLLFWIAQMCIGKLPLRFPPDASLEKTMDATLPHLM